MSSALRSDPDADRVFDGSEASFSPFDNGCFSASLIVTLPSR
jgi:hypothetical protein